jgi:hypothetical protein
MDYEGVRWHYAQISRKLPAMLGSRVANPTTFECCRHLRLSLSTKYHQYRSLSLNPYIPLPYGIDCLQWMFDLHFDSITISWHKEDGVRFNSRNFAWLPCTVAKIIDEGGILNALNA